MNPKTLDDDQRSNNEEDKDTVAHFDSQSCSKYKHIPADVTADILSRLPIKSIGRFILVSKSWRDVITRPCFSSLHAKTAPFSTVYGTNKITYAIYDSHVFEVFEKGKFVRTTFKPRGYELGSKVIVAGSCHGLLCLVDQPELGFDAISIFNPMTNERTRITHSNYDSKHSACYSFGYASSTNEYKVFKCITTREDKYNWRDVGDERYYEYGILTIGVDETWRNLSPHLFPDDMSCDMVPPCNGAFHWLVRGYSSPDNFIVAFDIAEESTRRMPIPRIAGRQLMLPVLNNRLCLYESWPVMGDSWSWASSDHSDEDDRRNILWKIEDYGDSWSPIVLPPGFSSIYYHDHNEDDIISLDCATKYGDMLFLQHRHIYLFCPKSGKYTKMGYDYRNRRLCEITPNFSSINQIIGKPSNI